MKHMILLFMMSTFFMNAFSQVTPVQSLWDVHDRHDDHGVFIGGAFNFWNDTKDKKITFEFCPEIGWRFNKTWASGIMLAYGYTSLDREDTRAHTFKLSPFVRYYYLHKGPFNLYLDSGLGYNYTKTRQGSTNSHLSGYEVGVRPGACVDLTSGLCLCLRMGFMGYRKDYFAGEEPEMGENGFGLRFAPEELKIGLELEF